MDFCIDELNQGLSLGLIVTVFTNKVNNTVKHAREQFFINVNDNEGKSNPKSYCSLA
jgi:hypothetical protein